MSSFRPDWTQSHHLLDIPVKTRILELYLKLGPQQHPSALSSLVLDSIRNEQESEGYDGGKIPSIMIRILQKLANKIQRLLDTVGNQRGVYGLHSDAQPGAKTRSDHQVQLVLMIRVFDELLDGLCPQLRVPVPSSNLTESEVDKFTPGLVHKKVVENADLYRKALFGGSLKEHILKIFHAEVDSENGGLSQEDLLVPTSSSDEHLCVWFDSVLGKLATHHGKQAAQHRFYHDLYLIAQGLVVMLKDRPTDSLPTKQVYYISATSTTLPFLPGRGRVLFVKEDTTGPKCLELALQRPSPFAYGSTQMSSTSRLIIVAICEILSQVEGRMVCVPRLDAKKYLDRVEQLPEKSQCWKWPSLGELLFPHENSLGPPRVPQLTVADPVSGSDIGGMATEPWLSAGGDTFDCGHTAAETRPHHLVGPPLHKDQSAAVDMPEPSCANIVSPPDTPPASELHSNVTAKHTFGVGQDDEEEPLAKRPRLAGCDSIDWNEGSAAQGTGPNSQDSVHESCPLDMNVDDLGHGLEAEVAPQIEVPEYEMLQENDRQGGEMGPSAGEGAGDFGTETGVTLPSEVSGLTLNDQLQPSHDDPEQFEDQRHDQGQLGKALARQAEAQAALPSLHPRSPPSSPPTGPSSAETDDEHHATSGGRVNPLQHYLDEYEWNEENDRLEQTRALDKALQEQELVRSLLPGFQASPPPPTLPLTGPELGISTGRKRPNRKSPRKARNAKAAKTPLPARRVGSTPKREMSMFPHQIDEGKKPTLEEINSIALFCSRSPKWPPLGGKLPDAKIMISVPIPAPEGIDQPSMHVPFTPAQRESQELFLKLLDHAMREPTSAALGVAELSEEKCRAMSTQELQDSFQCNQLVIRTPARTYPSRWSDEKGRINLAEATVLDQPFKVQNLSRRCTEPGGSREVIEAGTLAEILTHIEDSNHGHTLNVLQFPDPTRIGDRPDVIRRLDCSGLAHRHTIHHLCAWEQQPVDIGRRFRLCSGGAIVTGNMGGKGLVAWESVVKGALIFIISVGPKSPEGNVFDNNQPWGPDPYASDDHSFESLTEHHYWSAVYLPEGSTLVMQPYTPHLVLALEGTLATGGYFYSSRHLSRTLHAFRLGIYHDWGTAGDSHPQADALLHRMLLHADQLLRPNPTELPSWDASEKGPFPYPLDELAALVFLVGTDPTQGSLLEYPDEKGGWNQAIGAQCAAKQILEWVDMSERVGKLRERFAEWHSLHVTPTAISSS